MEIQPACCAKRERQEVQGGGATSKLMPRLMLPLSGNLGSPGAAYVLTNGSVLTQGCCRAVGYHESRVQTSFSHQEGRQLAEGGVTQPFDSSFTDGREFMDANGQIVQGLKEHLSSAGLHWDVLQGQEHTQKAYFGWVFTMEVSS